ncbi:RagB/SusD family nutrient uptake outer membrane protein [Foetidibacter luteolus]|uniref:RagB/SusD family nutrient uptake outer membrane protein n=1 Tax=Foetidibacter luteolus TaxID=2608880 RepID=UPI001A999060|nr:RagB/SusD family nutrient uptake outer membrane protein [Foetidibacter luteolus]
MIVIIATFTSCSKILDVVSPNEVEDEDVFTSAAGLRNARVGMYNTLQDRNYYGAYFPLLAECYTDNGTTGGYDVIDLNDIAARTVGTANIYVQNTYNAIYNSIYTANKIINNAEAVPGIDDEEKNNILGEAFFVRALCNFDLLRMYGEHWDKSSPYGISIVTSSDKPKDAVARSTVDASYQQIISDLEEAVSQLNTFNGNQYVSVSAARALLARVYLYYGDKAKAAAMATEVIDDSNFELFDAENFTKIYTEKLTPESVFELKFDPQNTSTYNTATYQRPDALRSEVIFLANADLNTFFEDREDDARAALLDYENVDVSIQPDGRTEKYRGETTKDNSAYVIRLAEMYLIRAEARGRVQGLADLNTLRAHRGLPALSSGSLTTDALFINAVLEERRAELNFEGHRLFDLARLGKVEEFLGADVQSIMPIPQREIAATSGVVEQNPGY